MLKVPPQRLRAQVTVILLWHWTILLPTGIQPADAPNVHECVRHWVAVLHRVMLQHQDNIRKDWDASESETASSLADEVPFPVDQFTQGRAFLGKGVDKWRLGPPTLIQHRSWFFLWVSIDVLKSDYFTCHKFFSAICTASLDTRNYHCVSVRSLVKKLRAMEIQFETYRPVTRLIQNSNCCWIFTQWGDFDSDLQQFCF